MGEGGAAEDDYDDWLEPAEALRLVSRAYGRTVDAQRWIMDRLRSRHVRSSAAATYNPSTDESEYDVWVKKETWDHFDGKVEDHFWSTGDLTIYDEYDGIEFPVIVRFMGIRLDPAVFDKLPEPARSAPVRKDADAPASAVLPSAGGRPRKDFWDAMWTEICRQLYAGDLEPKKQADIEDAMHEWLTANGHNAGPTAVRDRARKLFKALKE